MIGVKKEQNLGQSYSCHKKVKNQVSPTKLFVFKQFLCIENEAFYAYQWSETEVTSQVGNKSFLTRNGAEWYFSYLKIKCH